MGAAGAGAAAGAANGLMGAIKEIIDEIGDLAEAVVNNLKEVRLVDRVIEKTEIYPATPKRKKRRIIKTTDKIVITLWDLVLLYAFGRLMGWWGPIWEWPEKAKNAFTSFFSGAGFAASAEGLIGWLAEIEVARQAEAAAGSISVWSDQGVRSVSTEGPLGMERTTVELGWGGTLTKVPKDDHDFEMESGSNAGSSDSDTGGESDGIV